MPVLKNARHEAFAQAMAKGQSPLKAYADVGYRPNKAHASRLGLRDDVRARIVELQSAGAEKAKVDIARTLQELVRIGLSDAGKLFDEDGRLLAIHEMDEDTRRAIASVEVVTKTLPGEADDELDPQPHGGALARKRNAKVEYVHKIKLWDKNSALEKIAKHLGMFIERHEISGKGGAPLAAVVNVTVGRAQSSPAS